MVDPVSLVTTILGVVQMIGSAASTASQNKYKCLELAERANNLAHVLPKFKDAAANDMATARVLERLKVALGEALKLILSCQLGGMFSKYSRSKAAELDNVDKCINNCIMDLNLISQARDRTATTSRKKASAAGAVPPQTRVYVYNNYYGAQGGMGDESDDEISEYLSDGSDDEILECIIDGFPRFVLHL